MERVYKRFISCRRTDRYSHVKRSLWANSNCLHSINGVFSEIGIKKAHREQDDVQVLVDN